MFRGGRASSKSWSVAQFLVLLMTKGNYRLLLTREYQKNLKDSAKKLIEDTVVRFGLQDEFFLGKSETRNTRTGSEILYAGLHHNPDEIKSTEGIDVCWCEEAENTSQESLDMLIPTIRKDDSIIIFTYNPDLEDNPVHREFVKESKRTNVDSHKINWYDNPCLPKTSREEMEYCRQTDPIKYDWIWEGNCRKYNDAQVFKDKYRIEEFETPKDAVFMYGADWGFSQDPTTLIRCYVEGRNLYIDQAIDKVGVEIDDLPVFFDTVDGSRDWRIIADSARPEIISFLNRKSFNVIACKKGKGSVEEGIEFIKNYNIIIHPNCKGVIEEFNLYSYKVDRITDQILPKLEDAHNHYIDALRYAMQEIIRNTKLKESKSCDNIQVIPVVSNW